MSGNSSQNPGYATDPHGMSFAFIIQYYKVLLIHIENYRAFLKGEDEVVNSKDLYQTLNTRYVYLPYLQELVKQENLQHSFSCFELQKEIQRKINQNRSIGICKRII